MRFRAWRDLSAEYRQAVTGYTPWPPGALDAQVVMAPDVRLDESLDGFQEFLAREGIRSLAFIPLSSDAGVFGMPVLHYEHTHGCRESDLPVARAIASHVARPSNTSGANWLWRQSEQLSQAMSTTGRP